MRQTFGQLIQTSQDYCLDPETTSTTNISDTKTFIKSEINKTVGYIFSRIRNYKSQLLPQTMTTVADQIYYHYPPGIDSVQSITMTVGSLNYPMEVVDSQAQWNKLQLVEIASSTIPKFYFPRKHDFGLYPTPQDAYTVTLIANPMPKDMSADDMSIGTVAVTNNSSTVTGTDTAFTAAMVGRWFRTNDDMDWYKINAYTSATVITLESYFEGTTDASSNYIIGESPDIPVELHELIPYRVAGIYFQTLRKDPVQAQKYLNFFYTGDFYNTYREGAIHGGLLGIINRYKTFGRNNSQLVNMSKKRFNYIDEAWATTATS